MKLKSSENRRPIRSRNTSIAIKITHWLGKTGIRPNQLSILSLIFSFLAAICLLSTPYIDNNAYSSLLVITTILILLRLMCNLFDGMLAIEGGYAGKLGEIYNDLPDRPSDALILVALGYAAVFPFGITMGWIAAILAIMTAYVRLLGYTVGSKQYFIGPMAKQHRMSLVILACILSALLGKNIYSSWNILSILVLIITGSLLTILRRLKYIIADLEKNN